MRRPFVPASPEEAEAHREDLAYGAGARAWDPDPDRHADGFVLHRFPDCGPHPWRNEGPAAHRWICDCGERVYGRTPEACRRHGAEHLEGKR